jgi:hypothetical protein
MELRLNGVEGGFTDREPQSIVIGELFSFFDGMCAELPIVSGTSDASCECFEAIHFFAIVEAFVSFASDAFEDGAFVSFEVSPCGDYCGTQFINCFSEVRLYGCVTQVSVCITEQVTHFQSLFRTFEHWFSLLELRGDAPHSVAL